MPAWLSRRRQYEEIARFRQIGRILLKNGLGFVVERQELGRFVRGWRRRAESDPQMARLSIPERTRRTLEELRPAHVKLGQLFEHPIGPFAAANSTWLRAGWRSASWSRP